MKWAGIAMSVGASMMLGACGGSGGESGGLITVAPATDTAAAVTTPVMTMPVAEDDDAEPMPAVLGPLAQGPSPYANFDFASNTLYPAVPTMNIEPATYKPGATAAFVPVTLSVAPATTVVAQLKTFDGGNAGTAGARGIAGTHYKQTSAAVIFRPGDPLTQTVKVPLNNTVDGMVFRLGFQTTPAGAKKGNDLAQVTASNSLPKTKQMLDGFRAPRSFKATGTLQYEMTPATFSYSDAGGPRTLSTKFGHGRSQAQNGETGLYLDGKLYPGVEAPHAVQGDAIVLHSQQLSSPLSYANISWPHGASILSGHNTSASQINYGQYEWEARMPNRLGAWPALWLGSTTGWPPEIDVYEGFGYKDSWNPNQSMSHTIHGGKNNAESYQRYNEYNIKDAYGISGMASDYHRYAVDIQKDYITFFVDGVETFQMVNGFPGTKWYPLMQVAVRKSGTYSGGSGDMLIRSMRIYAN